MCSWTSDKHINFQVGLTANQFKQCVPYVESFHEDDHYILVTFHFKALIGLHIHARITLPNQSIFLVERYKIFSSLK